MTAQDDLKNAKQYAANRKYQRGYEKAKDRDSYFRSRETQIVLFGGAENMLRRYGVKTDSLDVDKKNILAIIPSLEYNMI